MAFRFFIISCLFSIGTCFSQTQDSISFPNNKIKDSVVVQTTSINEAIVSDNTHVVKVIEAEIDSTSIINLKDN